MFPIPPHERLVEERVCKHCSVVFPITDKDMEFYEKVSPVFGGKRYTIPAPTLCPDCRQQRRLSFRNERKLYKRKCDATGKDIISIYSPDKPYTVYHQDYWWSDKWNPLDYGRDFDFSRSAMEQMGELMRGVPRLGSIVTDTVKNSPYTNFTDSSESVYMCSDVYESSAVLYSTTIKYLISSLDCLDVEKSQQAYFCSHSSNLHNVYYADFTHNSNFCAFVDSCEGLSNCLFCVGIKNKKYYFLNKPITEEEYNKLKEVPLNQLYVKYKDDYKKLQHERIHPMSLSLGSEDVTGDNLISCHRAFCSFDLTRVQDVKYVTTGYDMQDVMDTNIHNIDCHLTYEAINGGKLKRSAWNTLGWGGEYIYYCDTCIDSSHLFLCSGLRNASYCILNKQYTREQYEELVPKIIEHMMKTGEWGEFFPSTLSPFGYNETVAQEYFPLTRDAVIATKEAIQVSDTLDRQALLHSVRDDGTRETSTPFIHGSRFNWSDYEPPFPQVDKIIPAEKLPENIDDIPDDILNWAIECEVTKKPFRIIRQELEFYRKHHLPIPRRHPDQRHLDRLALRNPRKLYERLCDCEKCEENWKKKGVKLEEGKDAGYQNPPDSPHTQANLPPLEGGQLLRKKMITTYSPERPETVYCEVCYEAVVVG